MTDTVTVRVIRSFEHRNWKPVVVRNVDLGMSCDEFRRRVNETIAGHSALPPPFKRDLTLYDSMKLETTPAANKSKSSNALINTTCSTDLITFPCPVTLVDLGFSHECDVSYFNLREYQDYTAKNS